MVNKVTVLMPVYNGAQFLKDAIESVLNQSFSDFEFLIINDGSTDNSREIIESFTDQRIRLINQENLGLAATLNKGVALAKSDLIARIDSDDNCRPDRLSKQYSLFAKKPDLVLVGSNIRYIDENGNDKGKSISPSSHQAITKLLTRGNYIYHPTVMFKKDAVLAAGGYDERIGCYFEDYALWLKLSTIGKFEILPQCLVDYRVHANSISDNTPSEVRTMIRIVAEEGFVSEGVLLKMKEFRAKPKVKENNQNVVSKRFGYHFPEPVRRLAILVRTKFCI